MTIRALNEAENVLQHSRVLVLGLAYKPNVGDIRTSAIEGVIESLREYGISVVGHDPHADADDLRDRFDVEVRREPSAEGVDGVVIGTPHNAFDRLDVGEVLSEMNDDPVVVDIDGEFEQRLTDHDCTYWRL